MKKDIQIPPSNHLSIGIYQEPESDYEWCVSLINKSHLDLKNVMVTSQGYDESGKQSSTLRYFIEEFPALTSKKVELIVPEVFGLNNSYFITYYIEGTIFDVEIIFEPNCIDKKNAVFIDILNLYGILRS